MPTFVRTQEIEHEIGDSGDFARGWGRFTWYWSRMTDGAGISTVGVRMIW